MAEQIDPRLLVHESDATSANKLTDSQQAIIHGQDEIIGASKRAAAIEKAKSKLSSSGGVLIAKSASQKRAELQKNKRRKPVPSGLASTSKAAESKPEPQPKPEPEPRQRVMLKYDNTPESHRAALDTAIKEGLVNPDNPQEVAFLMRMLQKTPNATAKDDDHQADK
jgi:hypothetical protein